MAQFYPPRTYLALKYASFCPVSFQSAGSPAESSLPSTNISNSSHQLVFVTNKIVKVTLFSPVLPRRACDKERRRRAAPATTRLTAPDKASAASEFVVHDHLQLSQL
jgi:hypothetical protein